MPHAQEDAVAAPSYRIPNEQAISVEHPCVVQNVDKAIEMLGGYSTLKEALQPGSEKPLGLSFKPEDPTSRKVISTNKSTDNVLLLVKVPKCIGKRKRGSDQPFQPLAHSETRDAKMLLRALRDNRGTGAIKPQASITINNRWRSMPDYVYLDPAFVKSIKSTISTQSYDSVKQFRLSDKGGLQDTETVPPPVFSQMVLPSTYSYRESYLGNGYEEEGD